MVFSDEAYLKAFPRKAADPTPAPTAPKSGNVLEEAEKLETPEPVKPEPAPDPEPEPAPEDPKDKEV